MTESDAAAKDICRKVMMLTQSDLVLGSPLRQAPLLSELKEPVNQKLSKWNSLLRNSLCNR
jgi:hypothetical protein